MPNVSKFRHDPNPSPADLAWFNSLDARSQSEIFNYQINDRSHPAIWAGLNQCFRCGQIGHRYTSCEATGGGMAFQHWRRASNGISYSLDMFNMTDEALAKAKAAFEPDDSDDIQSLELTQEDVDMLNNIEKAASNDQGERRVVQLEEMIATQGQERVMLVEDTSISQPIEAAEQTVAVGKVQQVEADKVSHVCNMTSAICYHCIGRGFAKGRMWANNQIKQVKGANVHTMPGAICYHCFRRGFVKGHMWTFSRVNRACMFKTSCYMSGMSTSLYDH
ncbi:uncharacterized protein MELLADRAFT_105348 [Melampsora larici-populina 98AG31]|uniref:CCHC-type domain-containing protein n=1 Tax=Melampsora larici-populina (strain 98AG31 / pathotype 3-4-7) TaxID=747676 RepID=F4RHU5_MELLP|nr:uncharacterized protein MELLADRAFT_105348 [Melampsora larici-populina 98AG31]EGG08074.1 hypothetical protein MELLADRAFT_105348 [Melampsora larici-populina 98AG31]